jgi:hypothetical protein
MRWEQSHNLRAHQGAVYNPFEGGGQRSAHGGSKFEAGVGAAPAVRTERRHHRHRHALHALVRDLAAGGFIAQQRNIVQVA